MNPRKREVKMFGCFPNRVPKQGSSFFQGQGRFRLKNKKMPPISFLFDERYPT
uniref:Uncharacterized protein n=1 Tax=Utricularia reniformis TaxID=192314 RepID=A0A1Y0B005_9LAMI|nr:hypothetical protein AEK19_MT0463 [Utricularia reniformis]ART30723.1 hypothetical protein AEK19_MT0463 [Utricularia reniformis]